MNLMSVSYVFSYFTNYTHFKRQVEYYLAGKKSIVERTKPRESFKEAFLP